MTLLRGTVRYRWVLLTLWGAFWCQHIYSHFAGRLGDFWILDFGGRAMTGAMPTYHAGALHLYAVDPVLQVGPPPLLLIGGLEKITPTYVQAVWGVLIFACGLISVRAVEVAALRLGVDRDQAAGTTLLGGLLALFAWSRIEQQFHLEDAIVVACMSVAVALIAGRRAWWGPALLIGFAVACKPWAVMVAPVLLALPANRIRAIGAAVGAALVWWVPFIVADPHTIGAVGTLASFVDIRSAMHALGWPHVVAPPGFRTMELLTGAGLATLAVLRGRWTAAPLAGMAGRLLLDPKWFLYYGVGPVVAALLWDLSCRRRVPVWTIAAFSVEFVLPFLERLKLLGFGQAALGVAIVGALVLRRAVRTAPDVEPVLVPVAA